MKNFQEGSFQQFWRREHLLTNNIPRSDIKGLILAEEISLSDAAPQFVDSQEERVLREHPEPSCNSHIFINCPLSMAFSYASNIFSLEEWTFGIREIQEHRGGLFVGNEISAPDTKIFLRCEAYTDCRVVDRLSAWDQGDELWMREYIRLVDARQSLGKPGTLAMHVTNRHPFYDKSQKDLPEYIKATQNRDGRDWLGDSWPLFCARQRIDMHNLKTILEARYGNP